MTQEHQGYPTRRTATRAPVDTTVRLHFDDSIDILEGMCENISIGGMFVAFDHPRPPGTLVRFEMPVEGGAICGLGEVAWMRADSVGKELPAGMGIKFRHLEQRDRQLIFKLVSEHIKERLAGRQVFDSLPPTESEEGSDGAKPSPWLEDAPLSALESSAPAVPKRPSPPPASTPPPASVPSSTSPSTPAPPPRRDPPSSPAPSLLDVDASFLDMRPPSRDPELEFAPRSDERERFREVEMEADPASESWAHIEGGAEFDPATRPSQRHDFPLFPALALLLLLLSAGGYLLRGCWADGGAETGAASEGTQVPDDPGADGSSSSGAGQASSNESTGQAANGAETSGRELVPPDEIPPFPPEPRTPEPLPVPTRRTPPSSPPPPPRSSQPEASKPRTQPKTSQASQPASRAFTRLEDISWTPDPDGGVRVVLTTNGTIPTGRYKHFRLGDDTPREVVRFFGVEKSFDRKVITVSGPEITQIRTGYHRKSSGNELHVVIDLTNARYRMQEVVVRGSRLEVWIR